MLARRGSVRVGRFPPDGTSVPVTDGFSLHPVFSRVGTELAVLGPGGVQVVEIDPGTLAVSPPGNLGLSLVRVGKRRVAAKPDGGWLMALPEARQSGEPPYAQQLVIVTNRVEDIRGRVEEN